MIRSNRTSRRSTRPTFETLEGRTLLSATPLLPEPVSLVPGHGPLSLGRVHSAFQEIESALSGPSTAFVQGAGASGPVSIDLDQDGVLDTVALIRVSRGQSDILRVSFGESDSHPAMAREMALDHIAERLLVADFDGDGRLDIFAQEESVAGTLLLSRSDELFAAFRHHLGHHTFAVADLDKDGVDDFVYGHATLGAVTQATTGGSGYDAAGVGAFSATDVQFADLDGDGMLDLAVSQGDGTLSVYAGLGNGLFAPQSRDLPDDFAGTGPIHVAFGRLADLSAEPNKANYLDMVIASASRSEVAIYHGEPNWAFRPGQVMHVGLAPSSVSILDLTKDGIPDLMVSSAGSNSIWILRGLGDGRFDDSRPWILATGEEPMGALVGHFSGGGMDLVSLDRRSNELTYYRNVADRPGKAEQLSSGGTAPTAAAVRDVNGDGYDDLIVANHDDGRVTLFYGGPDGLREGQTIERAGTHPSALSFGSGLQSSYQIYVMDDDSDEAYILDFGPPREEDTPTEGGDAPKLETTSEVRIFLRQLSQTTADSVPLLLVAEPDGEEVALGGGQGIVPAPDSTVVGSGEDQHDEVVPEETSRADSSEASSPSELAAQRYLLGTDDAAAPALDAAPMTPGGMSPEVRSETSLAEKFVEPIPSGTEDDQTVPLDDTETDDVVEWKLIERTVRFDTDDVLVGILLILGLPGMWGEKPDMRGLESDAGNVVASRYPIA